MSPPPLIVSPALRQELIEACEHTYPDEACGFLIGTEISAGTEHTRRNVYRVEPQENGFPESERHHRFSIDPHRQLLAEREAEAQGHQIIGFYHSHPDHPARPSEFDSEHAWPFYSYVIVEVRSGHAAEITGWVFDESKGQFEQQAVVSE